MFLTDDFNDIAARLRSAAAEVRFVPVGGHDVSRAGANVTSYLQVIQDGCVSFLALEERLKTDVRSICDIDRYLSVPERESFARIEAHFREFAPKFASLHLPEADVFFQSFPFWFRSRNDALTKLVRTMLDGAAAIAERLADEEREDVAAEAWSLNATPLRGDEETIPLADLRRELEGETSATP